MVAPRSALVGIGHQAYQLRLKVLLGLRWLLLLLPLQAAPLPGALSVKDLQPLPCGAHPGQEQASHAEAVRQRLPAAAPHCEHHRGAINAACCQTDLASAGLCG